MSVAVDPVQNPQAYQKMLIDLLGDDDPADVQHATSASLRHVIADAGDLLRTRPAKGEWSVIEVSVTCSTARSSPRRAIAG